MLIQVTFETRPNDPGLSYGRPSAPVSPRSMKVAGTSPADGYTLLFALSSS
jgi:hypothetical protein